MKWTLDFREREAHDHFGFRWCFLSAYQSCYSQSFPCLPLLISISKQPGNMGQQQPGAKGFPTTSLQRKSKPPWEYARFNGLGLFLSSPTCHLIVGAHLACRVSQNVYFRTVRGFPERCFGRVHILFMLSCFFRVYSARGGRWSTSVFVLLFKCCEHTWWRENVSKGELKCFQCSQIQKLPSFLRKKQTQCQSIHLPGSAVSLQSDTSTGTAQSKCPFGRKSEEHWPFIYSVNTTVWTCVACQSLGCWTTQFHD